jgi:hypothetical protein
VCHAVKVPPTARTAERVTKRAGLAAWLSPPCRLACCAVRPVPESAYVRSLFSAHVSLLIPQISDCTLCLKSGKIVRGKRAVTGDRHGGSHSKCERFGCRLLGKSRLHVYAHRTAPQATANIVDLRLFLVGAAAAAVVLRYSRLILVVASLGSSQTSSWGKTIVSTHEGRVVTSH